VEIAEKMARDRPEMTRYQLDLGVKLASLGNMLAVDRKFPPAEAAVQRSIAILEKLAADHPQDMKVASELGLAYYRMKIVLGFRGDEQSSLKWSGRYIQVLRSLARRDPRNRWNGRRLLWGALGERAETWTRLGRFTAALADFQEALDLAHENGDKEEEMFRAFHALTKARQGDLSELALLGDQVRAILKVGTDQGGETVYNYWMLCYDAACAHAALTQLALQDQRRLPAERKLLAGRDLERALGLLDRARATGEFQHMIRLDEVRKESLLDPLHSHPRFQLLMMDLAFPDDPFRP
jgi:tetratricopeptide (TPR) repeat protein